MAEVLIALALGFLGFCVLASLAASVAAMALSMFGSQKPALLCLMAVAVCAGGCVLWLWSWWHSPNERKIFALRIPAVFGID